MRKLHIGIRSGRLRNDTASWRSLSSFGWLSDLAFALEFDADLLVVFLIMATGAVATVVAVVLGDLLVDGVHDHASDWGVNLGKHIAGGVEGVLGSVAVLGNDENFVDERRHNDRVGHAVAWGAIEDDNVEMLLKGVNKLFVLLGTKKLGWVWWIGATGNDVKIINRSLLNVVAEVDDLVNKEMAQTLDVWCMEEVVQTTFAEVAVDDKGALAALGKGYGEVSRDEALALRG